jgi:hypothetical protein
VAEDYRLPRTPVVVVNLRTHVRSPFAEKEKKKGGHVPSHRAENRRVPIPLMSHSLGATR